jgi:hypothetical protein
LGDRWGTAYGLAYLSLVQASTGDLAAALRTSQHAITLAEEIGAGYLLALARFHHLWHQETAAPGDASHAPAITAAIEHAQSLGLDGLVLHLGGVRLLHQAAAPGIPDGEVTDALKEGISDVRAHAPVKGAWELLGAQVARTLRQHHPAINLEALEALVAEVCATKAESLAPAERESFLSTRGWPESACS